MAKTETSSDSLLQAWVPAELKRDLKEVAEGNDRSASAEVRRALAAWLASADYPQDRLAH